MRSARLFRLFGFLSIVFLLSFLVFTTSHRVYSVAGHIVISEVQVAGVTAGDEFVELYNPTNDPVDLTGWRLRKTGTSPANLVASLSGIIHSHGFFLVGSPGYTGGVSPDLLYSASSSALTGNSTVTLYSDAGATEVDKVGMGSSVDVEGAAVASPSASSSIERKASVSSTSDTMKVGGSEEQGGNGEDTNNNANDFVQREIAQPQNTASSLEPVNAPTLTPTVTAGVSLSPSNTPTVTETPITTPPMTATPTPTDISSPTPTVSPSPTEAASPSPTQSKTPTPTQTVTMTPSITSSPAETMTPTPITTISITPPMTSTPSPTITGTPPVLSLTPTMTPSLPISTITSTPHHTPRKHVTVLCSVSYHTVITRWVKITLPRIQCHIERD